jgi:hypothetical protein
VVDLGYIRSQTSQFMNWAEENPGTVVTAVLAILLVVGFVTIAIITSSFRRRQLRGGVSNRRKARPPSDTAA